ncbi:NAD-dependent epimerase/dehydratase family protein [Thermomonas sp. HDW16]|uniref:NAD-dependent epimerase/dehydratase family protein n=1 Tax=Thermomonas sp. HDW16 TaxID=2714945 RepID=UPI00140DC7E5|nr:NAD-dependent epimerase/dehydratase family protein [Thermomonas sp. HDW16]QIL20617.1 NAD-dependent epimerase/dehydratase family protein [Thermomonas sp. HDW16]
MSGRPIRLILTGATGFAGGEVLRQALADPGIERVSVLSRRVVEMAHPKLRQLLVDDFTDFSQVDADALTADACIWCLGVSQTAVDKDTYIRITHDYTLAAAQAMLARNPELRFCFLSGSRADQQERTSIYYGKIKGRTEKALSELTPHAFHFRPAVIRATRPEHRIPLAARIGGMIAIPFDWFSEQVSVDCVQLAHCLIEVAKQGADRRIFDNAGIKHWPKD